MRTKTLFAAAAMLAAGITASVAQSNVYSLNVVGYVNKVMDPGFHMINTPLNTTNNSVANLFAGPPLFTVIYKFTGGSFAAPNVFGFGGWGDPTQTLDPGQGAFISVPAGPNYTNTYVGEVLQGSLTNTLIPGFNMVGSKVPQAGGLQTDLGEVPGLFDIVYQFSDATHNYLAPNVNGFGGWGGGDPQIAVAEGFWYYNANAQNNWARNFTVQ
jgi:hypothetical protein